MKPLILSFFAVLLGYSLIFDKKEDIKQPIHGVDNSVYIQKTDTQKIDSIEIYRDETAYALLMHN